jgi:hypothetical protein
MVCSYVYCMHYKLNEKPMKVALMLHCHTLLHDPNSYLHHIWGTLQASRIFSTCANAHWKGGGQKHVRPPTPRFCFTCQNL